MFTHAHVNRPRRVPEHLHCSIYLLMHHALEIQEILLNIIRHCYPPGRWGVAPDLPILARTCRAFKDPALDVLWEELHDFSPLVRCLPSFEVCRNIQVI